MATPNEKNEFINSLYQLHQACNTKADDGGLTSDQRSLFRTAVIYLNSDIGKAWDRDFGPIPSDVISSAKQEILQAVSAASAVKDDSTARTAAKKLWDANTAIDQVLVG